MNLGRRRRFALCTLLVVHAGWPGLCADDGRDAAAVMDASRAWLALTGCRVELPRTPNCPLPIPAASAWRYSYMRATSNQPTASALSLSRPPAGGPGPPAHHHDAARRSVGKIKVRRSARALALAESRQKHRAKRPTMPPCDLVYARIWGARDGAKPFICAHHGANAVDCLDIPGEYPRPPYAGHGLDPRL